MRYLRKIKVWLIFGFFLFLNWLILRPVLIGPDVFFPAHDATWLVRLQQFDKTISLGQFPPRLAPDMAYGFGYPLFKYYAPLFIFLSWFIFKIIGDYALSLLLAVFLGNLIGSWGMFYLARRFWGFWGGLVASVAFIFLPFRALDIFVRAALSEILAINLLPFWLYFFIRLTKDRFNKKIVIGFILSSLSLLLAHNLFLIILAYCLPILIIYFLTQAVNLKKRFLLVFGSTFLILSLAAWFWLPAIIDLGRVGALTQATKTNFVDHFVYLTQLWDWSWGFGGSTPGLADGISFRIGKIQIVLALAGLFFALLERKKRKTIAMLFLLCCWGLFLSLSWSAPLWQTLPFLPIVQFPWRFLGLATPIIAFFSGGVVAGGKNRPCLNKILTPPLALLAIFFLGYFNLKYFQPQMIIAEAKSYYLEREKIWESAQAAAEFYPAGTIVRPKAKPDWPLTLSNNQTAELVADTPFKIIFRLNNPGQVTVNRFYLPGWQLNFVDNNEPIAIKGEKETGRIKFWANNSGEYELSFVTTFWEKIAYALTILGLIILLIIFIF